MFISTIFVLIFTSYTPGVLATIFVVSDLTNSTVYVMNDQPAKFIPDQEPYNDFQGYVVYADPPSACEPVKPPPNISSPQPIQWVLLARRYECDFQTKIENAQNASYAGIIVHNVGLNSTEAMWVKDPSGLSIFAVFIGEYDGILLREKFTWDKSYFVRIQDDFAFNGYLLPFAIVVVVCFVVMLLFMVRWLWQQIIRWIRERRHNRKRRLPASALKKLPTQRWTKGDPYETCAICIEDFILHDKIRVLPCSHGFHTDCIDPWLTKGRRVCPICKRKVVLAEERLSESDSDSDSETAPLLGASTSQSQPPASGGSTFVQQRENPFRRAQRRLRTRPLQRPIVVPDSETSSDDEETGSSSNPSHSNVSSGSHKSIVAEVHLSHNQTSGSQSRQLSTDTGSSHSSDPSASPAASLADEVGEAFVAVKTTANRQHPAQFPSSSCPGLITTAATEVNCNVNQSFGSIVKTAAGSSENVDGDMQRRASPSVSSDRPVTDNSRNDSNLNNAIV